MSIISEWFRKCRRGDRQACRKLHDLLWGMPMMTRELKRLVGPVAIVPIPKPWPGPDPAPLDANFLQTADVIRVAMGDPNPQPSFISLAEQLRGATEMRSAMERVIKALDAEISRLNQQSKT